MERKRFIIVNPADNVDTAITDISPQEHLVLPNGPASAGLAVRDIIPLGHKLALVRIGKGQGVIKYGQTIGRALQDIEPGCHVHVHNVESLRGRGRGRPHCWRRPRPRLAYFLPADFSKSKW